MVQINDGQCGMCAHYGGNNPGEAKLIQIRLKHEAPETLIEECGHPQLAPLHLVVTANSGCAGFEPVAAEG
ncbi:MAG: hypothetical protein R2853_04490 [Thermomicrobiales bacterium]